jgi:hypothetical protein
MLIACESQSACASILNCVIANCAAADGGSQMLCALGCSGNNFQQLSTMLPLFNCVQAGAAAMGGFGGANGGLGGLLGGGGRGGLGGLRGLLGTGSSSGG